jgi:hypothetical protein
MSIKKFKFVSPGIHINEVDRSVLPATPQAVGPVIIGRTQRGPTFRPTQVDSFHDFLEVFGEPIPGAGNSSDVWRDGVPVAATYASYAAQAYLRNNSPVTMIRLAGAQHPQKSSGGEAGWRLGSTTTFMGSDGKGDASAYGLFVAPSASSPGTTPVTGTLAAIFYVNEGGVVLSGNMRGTEDSTSGSSVFVDSSAGHTFTAMIMDEDASVVKKTSFNFNPESEKYIRKVFNTNPVLTNSNVTTTDALEKYFLGQSYDRAAMESMGATTTAAAATAVIVGLSDGSNFGSNFNQAAKNSQTGWVISQDTRNTEANQDNTSENAQTFVPDATDHVTRLFKFHSLSEGEWEQRNLKISIERIKASTDNINKYGSFSVVIRKIEDNDKHVKVVERFDGCSLNPNSENYISKKVGDMYVEYDADNGRLYEYGSYVNNSKFFRVEVNSVIDTGNSDPALVPFGFLGPVQHNTVTLDSAGVKATATLTVADAGQITATNTITFTTTGGNAVVITGHASANAMTTTSGASSDGTFDASTASGGSTNNTAQALAIATAINLHDDFTASSDGAVVTVTQNTVGGGSGNTTVTAAKNGGAGDIAADDLVIVGFAGGINDEAGDTAYVSFSGTSFVKAGQDIFQNHSGTVDGSGRVIIGVEDNDDLISGSAMEMRLDFPKHQLRQTDSQDDLSDPLKAYWGIDTTRSGATNLAFDESNIDVVYSLPAGVSSFAAGANTTTSYAFTLDDLSGTTETDGKFQTVTHVSGSRARGDSITAASGAYTSVLDVYNDVGGARFTMPLFGGFNGLDITEKEPFNDSRALASDATEKTKYAYHSLVKAIDMLADPEYVQMNLAVMPGILNENLTKRLIDTCEERADALAIIDPRGGYLSKSENTDNEATRTSKTAVKTVTDNMKGRNLNSSYGAAYYPWIQIKDSINGNLLYVPPSVIALGTLGSSETKSAVWFAPAGFTRGGLTEGASGLNVINVRHKLTSDERDRLYENNINPIASFPAEGIVVFGQKTLQATPSALDRINVRRLLILLKREISRIAATTLFSPNLDTTWSRFKRRAEGFLQDVKSGLGLQEFRVVLDETTTTPELIDRNIMYAKIFLKPARAIEFIALDFIVTNTGASFED